MNIGIYALASGALLLCAAAFTHPALAADDEHKLLAPGDIAWGLAPSSIPKGAQAAALDGDPSKEVHSFFA